MKRNVVTVRLDDRLAPLLDKVCRRSRRTRSQVIRDALWRQLAIAEFNDLRRRAIPYAEARGYLTDEDIFRDVS
ncbi:MAG: ribbon-helix-helix protein, CopG family [Candidatus Binataceae bacterium]